MKALIVGIILLTITACSDNGSNDSQDVTHTDTVTDGRLIIHDSAQAAEEDRVKDSTHGAHGHSN